MNKKTTKKFKVIIECEMQFQVGKKDTDKVFARDSDFGEIYEAVASDCLKYNAEDVKLRSLEEIIKEKQYA